MKTKTKAKNSPAIPADVQRMLRIDAAERLHASHRIDPHSQWLLWKGSVLASSTPIEPIADAQTLIDELSAAVHEVTNADQPARLIDAMVRFQADRPDGFAERTGTLRKALERDREQVPVAGLLGRNFGAVMGRMMRAWLGMDDDPEAVFDDLLAILPSRLTQRFRDALSTILLSTPTHSGGWIDPQVWVQRLSQAASDRSNIDEHDFELSLLRLAPDHRREALRELGAVPPPFLAIATYALGGKVDLNAAEGDVPLWVAACRTHDPEMAIPRSAGFAKELSGPDTLLPTDYKFEMEEGEPTPYEDFITIDPGVGTTPYDVKTRGNIEDALEQHIGLAEQFSELTDEAAEMLKGMIGSVLDEGIEPTKMLITQFHGFHGEDRMAHEFWSEPQWFNAYLAMLWPAKLDWYFALATRVISKRLDSTAASTDRSEGFLLPLLQTDRPLTAMAARALWIATASKDSNASQTAVDVWVQLIDDDRADVDVLASAFADIEAGKWYVYKRIIVNLNQVADASPLHAYVVFLCVEAILTGMTTWPRDVAGLLECLLGCSTRLGLSAEDDLRDRLLFIKAGKAKNLAVQILAIRDDVNEERREAISMQRAIRTERATRFTDSV